MTGRGEGGQAMTRMVTRSQNKTHIPIYTTYNTRTARAGLKFPVARVHRHLRRGKFGKRIGAGAPVYLAAVLEYLVAEILDLAENAAREEKDSTINPRHLQLAIRNGEKLKKLMAAAIMGVPPVVQDQLLPA